MKENPNPTESSNSSEASTLSEAAGLHITDQRTGKEYQLGIEDATIRALDLRPIKVQHDEFGMMAYDPGFTNTASCRSAITFIDGEKGILNYRGYPIEQLAESSNYLEVAWLLHHGELPSVAEFKSFQAEVMGHANPPDRIRELVAAFRPDTHPMVMLQACLAVLGSEYADANNVKDPEVRRRHELRLLGCTPAIAAYVYRRSQDLPLVEPDSNLSFAGNYLRMMLGEPRQAYEPNPVMERALDVLLILHEDHEQNCSANAVRSVGSSQVDPYSSVAAGAAALFGPLHGGANAAVLRMLDRIGSLENVEGYMQSCKDGQQRLMGFGHRVYKSYDPRARIIKQLADEVFEVTGVNPQLKIAKGLEQIALQDSYFVDRKLYPNVDFYSGLIYAAMGFDPNMFTVFFAVGRMAGWLAHWEEMYNDPENRIARPRQIYTGYDKRDYVAMEKR